MNGTSSDLDPFMFEVQLSFDVLPDSMGTGNEMGSGWQQYEPNYTFTMFPVGTLTTEYYWEESITAMLNFRPTESHWPLCFECMPPATSLRIGA